MVTSPINAALDLLSREHAESVRRVAELREQLEAETALCRQLNKAVKTLGGVDGAPAGKKASAKGATKEEVRGMVEGLLGDNPRLEADEVYGLVREKLAEQGRSAIGLGLRVKEVLAEGWIDEVSPGVFAARTPAGRK